MHWTRKILVIFAIFALILPACAPAPRPSDHHTVEVKALKWKCDITFTRRGQTLHLYSKGQKGTPVCKYPNQGEVVGDPVVTYFYNWEVARLEKSGTYQLEKDTWESMKKGDKYTAFECSSPYTSGENVWCFITKLEE